MVLAADQKSHLRIGRFKWQEGKPVVRLGANVFCLGLIHPTDYYPSNTWDRMQVRVRFPRIRRWTYATLLGMYTRPHTKSM
jgi:hypothetical protein